MRTAHSAQSQASQVQDPLEVSEQHLDFLAIFARLFVKTGLGDGTSHIARSFINAASDLADTVCSDSSETSSGRSRNRIGGIGRLMVSALVMWVRGLVNGRHSLRSA